MHTIFRKLVGGVDFIVFRIVLIYLVFGVFWILFSDIILENLVSGRDQYFRYSLYKGWVFIVVTAAMLYLLVRKSLHQQILGSDTLRISEERWKFALEGAGHGVWDWNLQTNHVFRSARWREIYGYAEGELEDTPFAGRELMHPDDFQRAMDDVNRCLSGEKELFVSEFRLRCRDGSWKWTLSRGMLIRRHEDGKPLRMIGTHTDITARKQSEAQVIRLAHYDQITELPNRVLFVERFRQEIEKSLHAGQMLTLMYLDLDHFKEVNDTFGHEKGDLLLREVGLRLMTCVKEIDTVARLGGDEFTIILKNLEHQAVTERIAQAVLDRLAEPFRLDNELVYISTSIGISLFPEDGDNVEVLLKNADQAMYVAKQFGRNRYHYFTPSLQEAASKRLRLISDLHLALSEQQFKLYYQPIVELATGSIYKAEALIRWLHPTRGLVSPAEFIPVAEETGLIVNIGDWVFNQASAQVAIWRQQYPHFQISINKSPVQFMDSCKRHFDWVVRLHELNIPGQSIAIEITEGLLLDAKESVIHQFDRLNAAGFQISIDDFGTGYSSLAYIRKFNVDFLKIDQSFTANIDTESSNLAVCEAIIQMGHKLGMKIIAEGIETQSQLGLLTKAGCDYGQGYFFSRPVPSDEFERLLAQAAAPG